MIFLTNNILLNCLSPFVSDKGEIWFSILHKEKGLKDWPQVEMTHLTRNVISVRNRTFGNPAFCLFSFSRVFSWKVLKIVRFRLKKLRPHLLHGLAYCHLKSTFSLTLRFIFLTLHTVAQWKYFQHFSQCDASFHLLALLLL